MSVSLSIKNVPDEIADALRRRAAGNQRSLNGEVIFALRSYVATDKRLTVDEALARTRAIGGSTPAESARMIREDRDGR
jgi:plasmid stability protein